MASEEFRQETLNPFFGVDPAEDVALIKRPIDVAMTPAPFLDVLRYGPERNRFAVPRPPIPAHEAGAAVAQLHAHRTITRRITHRAPTRPVFVHHALRFPAGCALRGDYVVSNRVIKC